MKQRHVSVAQMDEDVKQRVQTNTVTLLKSLKKKRTMT